MRHQVRKEYSMSAIMQVATNTRPCYHWCCNAFSKGDPSRGRECLCPPFVDHTFFLAVEAIGPTMPTKQYPNAGRAGRPKTITLDYEAAAILDQLPLGTRSQGKYLSRLIYED